MAGGQLVRSFAASGAEEILQLLDLLVVQSHAFWVEPFATEIALDME